MEYTPRQFENDAEIIEIGEGLLSKTLPKVKWTHEAHFASVVYIILKKPRILIERDMPSIIAEYNISLGGMNTDTMGYHETITQWNIRFVRHFLEKTKLNRTLKDICNELVKTEFTKREYLLKFYSKDHLFSVNARRGWVDPDLAPVLY